MVPPNKPTLKENLVGSKVRWGRNLKEPGTAVGSGFSPSRLGTSPCNLVGTSSLLRRWPSGSWARGTERQRYIYIYIERIITKNSRFSICMPPKVIEVKGCGLRLRMTILFCVGEVILKHDQDLLFSVDGVYSYFPPLTPPLEGVVAHLP